MIVPGEIAGDARPRAGSPSPGWLRADREFGADRRLLGAGPHQPGLGAAAERQAQRVEQDRLAGAGLAGQHAQPRPKRQAQPVDQHDVANGEAEQHAARVYRE